MKKNFDFDDLFDEAARNQLKDFEMPFNTEDWKQFERRLDRKDHLLPHLWLYKTLELFLMVLVVWTMFNFMHNDNAPTSTHTALAGNTTALDTDANMLDTDASALGTTAATHTRTTTSAQATHHAATTEATAATWIHKPTHSATYQPNTASNQPVQMTHATPSQHAAQSASPNRTTARTQSAGSKPTQSAMLNDALATLQNNSNTTNNNSNTHHNTTWQTSTSYTQAANDADPTTNTVADDSHPQTTATNTTAHQANTVADHTNAATPTAQTGYVVIQPAALQLGRGNHTGENDPLLKLQKAKIPPAYICQNKLGIQGGVEAHSRNSNGEAARAYTMGFVAETELSRKVALSTGVQFAHRSYDLEQTTQATTPEGLVYTRKEVRATSTNILTMPVQIQYSVYRDAKWRAYAMAGVAANLVISKRYAGTFQTYMPQPVGYTRTTTNINANEYDGGILQNAKFANTAYLSVQLGAGVERQLSDEWSLFIQPTFQYGATTYGATKTDRSHVFSVYMGIKKSF